MQVLISAIPASRAYITYESSRRSSHKAVSPKSPTGPFIDPVYQGRRRCANQCIGTATRSGAWIRKGDLIQLKDTATPHDQPTGSN